MINETLYKQASPTLWTPSYNYSSSGFKMGDFVEILADHTLHNNMKGMRGHVIWQSAGHASVRISNGVERLFNKDNLAVVTDV